MLIPSIKKVLSQPCLLALQSAERPLQNVGMKKSKSDSNLHKMSLTTKQLKSIIFFRKKIQKDGKTIVVGVQDIQFANEVFHSQNIIQSIVLTALMVYSIDDEEEKMKRIKLIIGSLVLFEIMKYT